MPDDPVTIGELGRRIESMSGDLGRRMDHGLGELKEDIHELGRRLDNKVSTDVFELKHQATVDRVTALEEARNEEKKQRASDRRWVIAAIVIPLICTIATVATAVLIAL